MCIRDRDYIIQDNLEKNSVLRSLFGFRSPNRDKSKPPSKEEEEETEMIIEEKLRELIASGNSNKPNRNMEALIEKLEKLGKHSLEISKFSGKENEDVEKFVRNVETAAIIEGWDDNTR